MQDQQYCKILVKNLRESFVSGFFNPDYMEKKVPLSEINVSRIPGVFQLNNDYKNKLVNIEIPDGFTELNDSCFENCKILKNIKLPQSLEALGNFSFANCNALESLDMPKDVKTIGLASFKDCTSLKEIDIPENVTVISPQVFMNCSSLVNAKLSTRIYRIDKEAFKDCNNLTIAKLPPKLEEIGKGAFENCYNLPNIIIPSKVYNIDDFAFKNCYNAVNIWVGESTRVIGEQAFANCSQATSIMLANQVRTIGNYAFLGCYSSKELDIQKSLDFIGEGAFSGWKVPLELKIPNNVKTVGKYAFEGWSSLCKVSIGSNETVLLKDSFLNDNNVNFLSLPQDARTLNGNVLSSFPELKSVDIPSSVREIEPSFFNQKTKINISKNSPYFSQDPDTGVIYSKDGKKLFWVPKDITNYIIPDSVEELDVDVFCFREKLEKLSVSPNIKQINAFSTYINSRIEEEEFLQALSERNDELYIRKFLGDNDYEDESCKNIDEFEIVRKEENVTMNIFDNTPLNYVSQIPNTDKTKPVPLVEAIKQLGRFTICKPEGDNERQTFYLGDQQNPKTNRTDFQNMRILANLKQENPDKSLKELSTNIKDLRFLNNRKSKVYTELEL